MGRLEDGWPEGDILDEMRRTYYISKEKGNLSIDIAKREKDILSSLHYKDGYSLYIGIPFCPTTCLYCSFTSYPIGIVEEAGRSLSGCAGKGNGLCGGNI